MAEKPYITTLVYMTPEFRERIDDWRFENRIASRSEAIKLLIEKGLADDKKKK